MQDTQDMKIEKEIPSTRLHECSDGKHRNDEQFKEYKKMQELFLKHPEEFIHVEEIVIGALKDKNGSIGVMIGKCSRQDLELGLTRISYRGFSLFQQMEIQQAIKREKEGIITAPGAKPSGGIITS